MIRILWLIPFFLSLSVAAQELEYCRYFTLAVKTRVKEGKTITRTSAEINRHSKDQLSLFIQQHHYRYEFLLLNKTDSQARYSRLLPDRNKAKALFCADLASNARFDSAFKILTQLKRKRKPEFTFYSGAEMMLIASRFFKCDQVRQKDTAVSAHICIGLNGLKELPAGGRDYSALEAFCYESIMEHLLRDENTALERHFTAGIADASRAARKHFTGFDAFLEEVRTSCYQRMERDTLLQTILLRHYRDNKGAMNLVIR